LWDRVVYLVFLIFDFFSTRGIYGVLSIFFCVFYFIVNNFNPFFIIVFFFLNFFFFISFISNYKIYSFECGFDGIGLFQNCLNINFFFIMLIFVLFDLELVLFLGFLISDFGSSFLFFIYFFFILFSFYLEWFLGKLFWFFKNLFYIKYFIYIKKNLFFLLFYFNKKIWYWKNLKVLVNLADPEYHFIYCIFL